jgi:glycosyltransferase involved in cell wall biosynthesis
MKKYNLYSISIALCTYNGEKYLYEQLESISKQTRLPDELVVCDDGSFDSTVQILRDFKKRSSFPVRLYCNEARLGYTKNFEKAIKLCKGNIIVLCDQDDVWVPYKIEKLEYHFKNNPNIGYVFSDAFIVDERLFPLSYTMWDNISFSTSQRRLFKNGNQVKVLLKHNVVTGATMAIREETRDWFLPISDKWVHDEWIALLLSAIGIKGDFIEEPLISYRQHHQQAIGAQKNNLFKQFQKAYAIKSQSINFSLNKCECLNKRLTNINGVTKKDKKYFEEKLEHLQTRKRIHGYKKWKYYHLIYKEILNGNYNKYSNGWKSVAKDILF